MSNRKPKAGAAPVLASVGLTLLVVVASLGLKGGTQAEQTPLYDVRANQVTATDQHEPTLAVDPTNPNNVLAAAKDWRTGPKQVWHYRSTDGGRSWTDGHITTFPTELPNQSDPVLAYGANGTAYMAVLAYNQNDFSIGGLFVSRSDDKGATWQQPVLVSANSLELFNDKEWLTTDRSSNPATRGNVYTTWTLFTRQGRNERGEIMLSRSTDGGKSFSGRVLVSLPDQTNTQGSYPAVGPDGALYVLYYNGAEESGGLEGLYVARSTDGGQTFPQVRLAASVVSPPSPLPGSSFRVFVLPTLAVDPRSGALHITWNDYRAGDSDVMLTTSTDGGGTWSEPLRVNDDPPTPAHDQFFPTAIVGSDGMLHLLWLDRRDDPENVNYLPYYATSTDGGKSVTKNLPVSRTRSDPDIGFEGVLIGDYIAVDVSGDGRSVYAAWVDTRNGDQDIYFAQFPTQSGPAPPNAPALVIRPTPVAVPSPQPLTGFTDEAFLRSWERADRPVARGRANRPWLWGPVSFGAALEAYAQGRSGNREVQYFDKARMEINDPTGDREGQFFVTNGLLVVELISGRVQTGDAQFEPVTRPPSQVPVAGDINSPDALTYASLAPVASLNNDKRANDRTGQPVIATLDRAGNVRDDPTRGGAARVVRYEPVLGHNIPDVFWTFMNATGPVYSGRLGTYSDGSIVNWITDLGYPITEPYWTNVRIGGASKRIMLQAFQRRVLTFVPDNPPGWQVEMGNVGRHYFDWRYKTVPSPKSRVQSQRTTDDGRQIFDSGLGTLDSGLWTHN